MTEKNSLFTFLDIIYNADLRMAIGAFRSNLINSILNIIGEQPLSSRRNQLMLQYTIRTVTDQNKSTYPILFHNRFENTFNNNKNLLMVVYSEKKIHVKC